MLPVSDPMDVVGAKYCRGAIDNVCKNAFGDWFGLGYDGGYQQYLLVTRPRNLSRIPDNVSADVAAASTDAVLTPYHAIKMAQVSPTSNILLIGAGGLGGNAIQVAKAFGAKVTVLDKKRRLVTKQRSWVLMQFMKHCQNPFLLALFQHVLILFQCKLHLMYVKSMLNQRV